MFGAKAKCPTVTRVWPMNADAAIHPVVRFLLRNSVELLALLAVLFILQTGLVPFDFIIGPAAPSSDQWFSATTSRLTFPDVVSNIFLYLPIGILLHWVSSRRLANRTLALLVTIALAAALSGAVEWLQAYSPARVSSMIDLVANVVGATLGASVSWLARWIVPAMFEAVLDEFCVRPQAAALKAYCLLLVVFAAIPFSFSFDTIRLKKAVKAANFVPFATHDASLLESDGGRGARGYQAIAYQKWRGMKRWSRWTAECASFAVLAWLLYSVSRTDYGFGRGSATALVWYLGGGLAFGLSALQLLIVSRMCDVTDILFRLIGLAVGLVAWLVYGAGSGRSDLAVQALRGRTLAKLCLVLTVGYILYTGLIPMSFNDHSTDVGASIASESFLPFFAYFLTRFDLMMADAMEKFASYVVFAALLATCWSRVRLIEPKSRLLPVIVVGVTLSAAIEAVQVFIPVRVTSLTDPILAAAGCLTGVLAQQHAVRFYWYARSPAPAIPEDHAPQRKAAPRLDPTDALVTLLMDPHPDAPAEPSPSRTPDHSR